MRALLSFFTALHVRGASLEEVARGVHLLPLVGLVTGLPGAVVVLLGGYAAPPGVAATLGLGAVLLAAGLHHTDGVLDVGDALMVRGAPERRREVLKDARVGVGGIAALFLAYAPALAALAALVAASPARAALALLAAEVSARSAMVLTLAYGEPAEQSSSSVLLVRALGGSRRTVAVLLAFLVPLPFLLPVGGLAPLAVVCAPLAAVFTLRVARAAFGGIGGDVVGATGEASRAAVLVVLSTNL
ncbi:MAG TPA: adenosylcobinamide-GDP ribazoletransferase [Rubrobacteraceae bacterium]|nr:adenosylcobinamide-GDP ribazoletransferase [Rubrobacteraceae bacterium]